MALEIDDDPESYGLDLIEEECAEVIQEVMKARRFGIDRRSPRGTTPRLRLERELGDIQAAIYYLIERGVVSATAIHRHREDKLAMLFTHVDDDGRRLAP